MTDLGHALHFCDVRFMSVIPDRRPNCGRLGTSVSVQKMSIAVPNAVTMV